MIKFTKLLLFPIQFKKRQDSWRDLSPTIFKIKKVEDKIFIVGKTNNYEQVIYFDGKIDLNTFVKVKCTCESFKFEFSRALFSAGSLLDEKLFFSVLNKTPKEKNIYQIACGCKHIIALSNLIISKKNKLITDLGEKDGETKI